MDDVSIRPHLRGKASIRHAVDMGWGFPKHETCISMGVDLCPFTEPTKPYIQNLRPPATTHSRRLDTRLGPALMCGLLMFAHVCTGLPVIHSCSNGA